MRQPIRIASILFLSLCLGTFLLINWQRGAAETLLDAIGASVGIWAIFMSIFLPYISEARQRSQQYKEELRAKAEALQAVKDGIEIYRGFVDGELDKIDEKGCIPRKTYAPYRPYLSMVESKPELFDLRHMGVIAAYESVIWEKTGELKALAQAGDTKDNIPEAKKILSSLSRYLKDYVKVFSFTEEEHNEWLAARYKRELARKQR